MPRARHKNKLKCVYYFSPVIFDQFFGKKKTGKKYDQIKNKYTLEIMRILRSASQGSNFTGSYKKKSIFNQCIHYIHMKCFVSPISSISIVCILNLNTEGGTSHNKYRKRSIYHHSNHPKALHIPGIAIPLPHRRY